MDRIGMYMAESHERANREHLNLPLEERLLRSWLLYEVGTEAAHPDRPDDDPSKLDALARARALCSE